MINKIATIWAAICPKLDNIEEMEKFLKNTQPNKTESWRNRKSEQAYN